MSFLSKTNQFFDKLSEVKDSVKSVSNKINDYDTQIKALVAKGVENLTANEVRVLKDLQVKIQEKEFSLNTIKNSVMDSVKSQINSTPTIQNTLGNFGFNDLMSKVSEATSSVSEFTKSLNFMGYNNIQSKLSFASLSDVQNNLNTLGLGDIKEKINSLSIDKLKQNLNTLGLNDLKNKFNSLNIDKLKSGFNSLGLDKLDAKVAGLGLVAIAAGLSAGSLDDVKTALSARGLNDLKGKLDSLDLGSLKSQLNLGKIDNIKNKLDQIGLKDIESQLNDLGLTDLKNKISGLGLTGLSDKIEKLGFSDLKGTIDNLGLGKVSDTLNKLSTSSAIDLAKDTLSQKIDKLGIENVKNELKKIGISDAEAQISEATQNLKNLGIFNDVQAKMDDLNLKDTTSQLAQLKSLDTPFLDEKNDLNNYVNNTFSDTSSLGNIGKLDSSSLKTSDQADTSALEAKKDLLEQEQSVTQGASKETFYGLGMKIDPLNSAEQLLNWRYQTVEGHQTDGFKAPWDWRFEGAYTTSQSIGNSMPYGPEWVGSPSLMNPLALIRFDHLAGLKHHQYLLDQAGHPSMRYGGPTIKYTVVGNDEIENRDEKTKTGKLTAAAAAKYGLNDKGIQEVTVQENGQVSYVVEDNTREVWVNDKGEEIVWDSTIDNKYKPNSKEYWYAKEGWVECTSNVDNTVTWVPTDYCTGWGGKIKQDALTPDKIKEIAETVNKPDFVSNLRKNVEAKWVSASYWKFKSYYRETRWLHQAQDFSGTKDLVEKEPNITELCNPDNFVGREQFQYDWRDFLYCTYFGKIPNNYLVTLRRFPLPVIDNAKTPGQDDTKAYILPIAKAVTWVDESTGNKLEELMKMSWNLNWKELDAEDTLNQTVQGNEQGLDALGIGKLGTANHNIGLEKLFDYKSMLNGGDFNRISGWDEQRAKFDPYEGGPYANKVYGPVNVISKTQARSRGLDFQHAITLNFHYTLKSIGGVNPKAAMLDILANMLALTYNNAPFWGGAIRYFPNKPQYPMPGGKKGMDSWYNGNVTGFLDGMVDEVSSALGGIGDTLMNLFSDPVGALKQLATGGTKLFMAKKIGQKRPDILKFRAILTGDPVGEWHMTVGNPFNPIISVGNLIVKSTSVSFSERLGVDDFPEEMTVTITLDHGRPRDKGDIESMFNRGGGRLHYAYFGQGNEAWNLASSTQNSKVDRPAGQNDIHVNGGGKFEGYIPNINDNYDPSQADMSNVINNTRQNVFGKSSKKALELAEKMGLKSGV